MKKSVYHSVISILILVILISVFGVFKTSISLTTETANPEDCISMVSGRDLCQQMKIFKITIIICLVITSGLLSFRGKIVKI